MTEREQFAQEWRDNYLSRGGVMNDDAERQATAYADRILEGRAETERMIAAAAAAEQTRANVAIDHAMRLRGERKHIIAAFINRHTSDGYAVTEQLKQQAAIFADRVLERADPRIQQRAREQAERRREVGRLAQDADIARIEPLVTAWASGDETIPALRAASLRIRRALDEIDARLMRRAMRPERATPRSSEDTTDTARTADSATVATVATTNKRRAKLE